MGYYGLAQFTYEASQDQYRCPQGHVLHSAYRMEGTQEIQYRADAATCNACPVKAQCTESPRGRHVHRSFFADYVERVKGYQQTPAYQKALNKRKVWIEPLFGEGKQWHGMRQFRLRRLWRVNCEALMIASGQNLKRLLQKRGWGRRPFPTEAVALRPPGDEEADVLSRNIPLKNGRVSVAVASLVSYEVVRAFFEAQSSRFSLITSTFVISLWPFHYPFFPFYCFSYSFFPTQGKAGKVNLMHSSISSARGFSTGWSVYSTHLFRPLKPHQRGCVPVHIAIWKSMSKNAYHEMSSCTLPSR